VNAWRLVHSDHRHVRRRREVHDRGDLLAGDLAEAATEDREVLGEHADWAAVHRAVAGDHRVPERSFRSQTRLMGPVPHEAADLGERPGVQQQPDALPRGRPTAVMLPLRRFLDPHAPGLALPPECGNGFVNRWFVSTRHRRSPLPTSRVRLASKHVTTEVRKQIGLVPRRPVSPT